MDLPKKAKTRKLMKQTGESSSSSGPLAITTISTDTAVSHALVSNDRDLFDKVFTNDIVWNKLGSYLNLDDLKDCRLTCQLFNTKIIDLKSFKDRARLDISLSKFPASDLGATRVQWRHLAINIDGDQDDTNAQNSSGSSQDPLSDLSPLLSSIISLKLYRTNYRSFEISPEVPETFSRILPMMSNIQEILIDLKIFEKIDVSWFSNASVALMSNVKEFHLKSHDAYGSVPDQVMRCAMSLPLACAQLQVLHMDSFAWKRDENRDLDSVIDRLFRVLRQNQDHLRSLEVPDPELWTTKSVARFGTLPKFPQLKVLKLQVDTKESSEGCFSWVRLIEFLNNQPESLEELDLEFVGSIPPAVFQVLQNRAVNLNLKVLRISTTRQTPTWPSDMTKWKYLKETNLEEFSYDLKGGSGRLSSETLKDFFGALPKKAKKLSIEGLSTRIRRVFNLEVSKCFDPKVLTHLSLRRCSGLLKDSVLQEIWKTLKNLRLLGLSDCGNNCTDWGFTGIPAGDGPEGVSISLLKGLKSLTLQSCSGLTDHTLIHGIKFQELQFLDLQDNFQFTKIGFLAVIRQNPSLQTFVTDHDHETHEDLRTHIDHAREIRTAKINSRLTREFLIRPGCSRCVSVDQSEENLNAEESRDESEPGKEISFQDILCQMLGQPCGIGEDGGT